MVEPRRHLLVEGCERRLLLYVFSVHGFLLLDVIVEHGETRNHLLLAIVPTLQVLRVGLLELGEF